ncbi:MAG: heparinase II/III family protein [Polyangiaceae bacterium]
MRKSTLGLIGLTVAIAWGCGDSSESTGGSGAQGGNATGGSGAGAGSGATAGNATGGSSATGGSGASAGSGAQGPVFPEDHPRIYLNSVTRARLDSSLANLTPEASRFKDLVDAELAGGDSYDYQPWYSALIYVLSGEAKYADDAIARTDSWVANEESLISAGQRAEVAADSYLYVGDHIGSLALVYDWCFDRLTEDQRSRWLAYANRAVNNVWNPEAATWGGVSYPWSGWSIDNPSNNYYYSFLRATMLLGLASRGENSEADGWIDKFRKEKIQDQLVPTFQTDLVGGGSREGTGYGVAMMRLFELYELWEQTTGERIADLTPHARDSMANLVHAIVPTRDRLAPVGDHARDSSAELFDYHRNYLQLLIRLFPTDPLAANAQYLLEHSSVPEMSQQFMYAYDFLYQSPDVAAVAPNDLNTAYFASGTGQLYLRESWDTDATWVHLIAGPYTESHAHQDQGSFMLYGGAWLAADTNLTSHSGIRQELELHNLVRVEQGGNTLRMRESETAGRLVALHAEASFVYAACDTSGAYDGGVQKLERELVYVKPDIVVLYDRIDTPTPSRAVWQVNAPSAFSTQPDGFRSGSLRVIPVHPAALSSSVFDWGSDSDISSGYRLDLSTDAGSENRILTLVTRGDAISTRSTRSDGSSLGVDLTLSDGTRYVIDFERDAIGVHLERTPPGQSTETHDLGAGVDALPLRVP